MSLAVGVGVLADLILHDAEGAAWLRQEILKVNLVLVRHGLPRVHEPETLPPLKRRSRGGFPYRFLHHLRRAHALLQRKVAVTPTMELSAADDELIFDVSTLMSSHLLCHADAEGFYVPVDFRNPLFDGAVPGGMLGSSQALLRELLPLAPAIGIALLDGELSAREGERLAAIHDGSGPFWREQIAWFALFEAAACGVQHGAMVVFQ